MIKSNVGSYDIDTHIGNGMRYFVFDKRIDVIGTTSEKDYHSVVGNSTLQDLVVAIGENSFILILSLLRYIDGCDGSGFIYT